MRICLLIDAWKPIWGGGQVHVWEITKRLIELTGWEFDIFTRELADNEHHDYEKLENHCNGKLRIFRVGPQGPFFSLWRRLFWIFKVTHKVLQENRKIPYDIIHGHAYVGAIPSKILGTILRLPVIFTVHGANNLDLKTPGIVYWIEKFLLTYIPFNQVISVTHKYLKYFNVNKNIAVIPNGVDIKMFGKRIRKRVRSIRKLLWIGRYDKVKAIDILLLAFKEVCVKDKKLKLLLVGNGLLHKKIAPIINKLNLNTNVQIIINANKEELVDIYSKADIFILPSYSEGLALTLLEAWAAKLPVIVSRVGDHPLYVENGKNGYLITPGSVSDLVKTLMNALKNKQLARMGNNGYKLVKGKFTWDVVVSKTHNEYISLKTKNNND